jgi:hypothetical protein
MVDSHPRFRIVVPDATDVINASEVRQGAAVVSSGERPTDEQVISTLVAHNGIPARAAAMLGMTEEAILEVAARNARLLSTRARSRIMLASFSTLLALDAAVHAGVDDMPMDALGRTYASTMQAFTNLAGQFEENTVDDDSDDATAAKDSMVRRLENMGKREEAERILNGQHEANTG